MAKINRNKVIATEEIEESRSLAGPLFRRYKAQSRKENGKFVS